MTKKFLIQVRMTLLLLLLCFNANGQQIASDNQNELVNHKTVTAQIHDLRKSDWGNSESYSLEGDWLLAWKVFTHNKNELEEASWHKVLVPGSWQHKTSTPPNIRTAKGFGTYYKKILVSQELNKIYLHLPDMASAYELWSNGVHLGGNGVIATQKINEKPAYLPRVYELTPQNGEVEIFIKTSNYHYLWGGLWSAPSITDESGVYRIRDLPRLKATISGTILFSTAIFCLLIFLSRPQDKKILYFSLFCFAIALRRLSMDERTLYMLNSFDWQSLQAVENITMYLMLPFFLSYFQLMFPEAASKKLRYLGWLTALPFCLAALVFDVERYVSFNLYFQLILLIFVPLILYSWVKAFRRKLKNAKAFGLSLFVFLFAVINDMLNYSYVIQTTNLTHMGVLGFVLFQLGALVNRYLTNFKSIETLSTTLQEQNQTLVKLDEFKDDFLASTSHELRMPLHGIAGLAKTIKQESPNLTEVAQNRVNLIEATAKRLGNLVNDILDISSMKHDKLSIQVMPTYLSPLIESTIQSLQPLIKHKPIKLDFDVDINANQVLADEQRVQQILYNLIGNSIKFTDQGYIHIKVFRHNNDVNIQVSDSGTGISTNQLEKALQPYETISNPASNDIRGSGLGLAITKMLVELHQGTLTLNSKEGQGTTVEFTLPWADLKTVSSINKTTPVHLDQDAKHYESEVLKATFTPDVNKETTDCAHTAKPNELTKNALIFYADDEEVNRELVKSQLVQVGYQIQVFPDGQSLLEALKHADPELILLDWMMPGKNGLEVCREIRQRYDAYLLPVIILTARHQISDVVKALNVGANDYLTKPYHEQELAARVYSQVSVKRLLLTSLENKQLKSEVALQEVQKHRLGQSNLRLTEALDASHENIILLNEDLDIVFANTGAKSLWELNAAVSETEDIAINGYLDEQSIQQLNSHLNANQVETNMSVQLLTSSEVFTASVRKIDSHNERLLSLIFHNRNDNKTASTQSLLTKLTQELADNRQRMEQIESTLGQLNAEQVTMQPEASPAELTVDPQELIVKTLRITLFAWERYTHKTKADLAEESHCWRVYLDGTTAKTRTLDKYLSVKTLPAKPRWRAVIKTANYVLDHCQLSQEDEQELCRLIHAVNEAFS